MSLPMVFIGSGDNPASNFSRIQRFDSSKIIRAFAMVLAATNFFWHKKFLQSIRYFVATILPTFTMMVPYAMLKISKQDATNLQNMSHFA